MYRHNYVFGQKPRCLAIFGEKSAVFAQFYQFYQKWRGIAVLAQNYTFSQTRTRSLAELQKYVGFFEKSSVGPHTRAFPAEVLA